jgi:hypothetical protein
VISISQQYYTRERKGLFRSAEGYDSIAKSNNLDDNFIKKYLHPFCFYDPPRLLDDKDHRDSSKYPESYMLFHLETGDMVVGRSVYVDADFTGLRSTFFTHNYVIPKERCEYYTKNIEKAIFSGGYVSSYNIENGTSIPEIEELPYDPSEDFNGDGVEFLKQIGIDEDIYKRLVYAVFTSLSDKRKVYIALDVNIGDMHKYAKILLKYLFKSLPYEVRRNCGYITYSKEAESKRYINIVFVESDSLRVGNHRTDMEYVFDFVKGRFLNTDIELDNLPYLDFAWNNINNTKRSNKFFSFAEDMTANLKEDKKQELSTYDKLCTLFQIEEGNLSPYALNRDKVAESVFPFLAGDSSLDHDMKNFRDSSPNLESFESFESPGDSSPDFDMKLKRMDGIYNILIEKEKADIVEKDYLPSINLFKSFTLYYSLNVEQTNKKILQLSLFAIKKAAIEIEKNQDYIFELFDTLQNNMELFRNIAVISCQSDDIRPAIEAYFKKRFLSLEKASELFNEINFWESVSSLVLCNPCFKELWNDKTLEILNKSNNKVAAGKSIHGFCDTLLKEKEADKQFIIEVLNNVDEIVCSSLQLDDISTDEIKNSSFLQRINDPKCKAIDYVRRLIDDEQQDILVDAYDIFNGDYGRDIKKLIRRIYANNINPNNYEKLISGFIRDADMFSVSYDYSDMLNFIFYHNGSEEVYNFVLWSYKENVFCSSPNLNEYRESIKDYFLISDKKAFKHKESKRKLYSTQSRALFNIFQSIEDELSNPMARFYKKHKKGTWMGVAGVVIAILLIFGGIKLSAMLTNSKKDISDKNIPTPNASIDDAALKNSIEEAIKGEKISTLLDNYFYFIKCDIKYKEGFRGPDKLSIKNKEKSEDDKWDFEVTENNEHNGSNISYQISLKSKKDLNTEDDKQKEEADKLCGDIGKIILEKFNSFIDSQSK